MPKVTTQYLDIDPWLIRKTGFHADRAKVSESIFALGNEFMGVRGYFDEGYSGQTMIGSYVNGVFEEEDIVHPQYFKGFATRTHFMVNGVDWLHARLWLDDEQLDLARVRFDDFVRTLDMRTGVLQRSFIWTTRRGKRVRVSFSRFVSMADAALGCQRVELTPLNFSSMARVRTGLDFSVPHYERGRNLWRTLRQHAGAGSCAIMAAVQRSGHRVAAGFTLQVVPASRLRTVGPLLSFAPGMPPGWRAFSFRLLYRGATLHIAVNRRAATFSALHGPPVTVRIYGRRRTLGARPLRVPLHGKPNTEN